MNKSAELTATVMPMPQRTVGFLTACGIVIANIIGTGVFTSLGFQLLDIHSGFALLMLWVVGGIAALFGAGFFVESKQPITFVPHTGDTMSIFAPAFAVALVYVMYSYSGWNASSYIIGEVKKPERNVPRSLLAGTLVVMGAYVLLNAIFLMTAPQSEMRGQLEVG